MRLSSTPFRDPIATWNRSSADCRSMIYSPMGIPIRIWQSVAWPAFGCCTIFSISRIKSARKFTPPKEASGTQSCIDWKAISGTVSTGIGKSEITQCSVCCPAKGTGIQMTLLTNASRPKVLAAKRREGFNRSLWLNGRPCLSFVSIRQTH